VDMPSLMPVGIGGLDAAHPSIDVGAGLLVAPEASERGHEPREGLLPRLAWADGLGERDDADLIALGAAGLDRDVVSITRLPAAMPRAARAQRVIAAGRNSLAATILVGVGDDASTTALDGLSTLAQAAPVLALRALGRDVLERPSEVNTTGRLVPLGDQRTPCDFRVL
jgi:hypothetical protein